MQTCYGEVPLPTGIRSRLVDNGNGLSMHVLEAGFDEARPCILLLHGFPELAYSWRSLMPALQAAGYYVIAPDQRGYGRSTGWDADYDGDLASFQMLNLVRDILGLLDALGVARVVCVAGHDFGSPVAAWCALLRPDLFGRVALLSAPFPGPPSLSFDPVRQVADMGRALAALNPPRKHYQSYYATRAADRDMRQSPQGMHAFLRAYYHCKSADWHGDHPFPLAAWSAQELAQMPRYYIMNFDEDMARTAADLAPSAAQITACTWMNESELDVYAREFDRVGFQGGLQWYRSSVDPDAVALLQLFYGRKILVPATFIAGASDWGSYQSPGALAAMAMTACAQFHPSEFIDGAGHWVQQEQPAAVAQALLRFIAQTQTAILRP